MSQHQQDKPPAHTPGEREVAQTPTTLNQALVREAKQHTIEQLARAGILPNPKEML